MAKSKLMSFVDQFVATVKGDDAKALAEKVYRKRIAALKTELHNAEGDLVDKEQNVEDAKERLVKARLNNGVMIINRKAYVSNLIRASEAVKDAEEALEAHKALINFLKAELDI